MFKLKQTAASSPCLVVGLLLTACNVASGHAQGTLGASSALTEILPTAGCEPLSKRVKQIHLTLPNAVAFTNRNSPASISQGESSPLRPIIVTASSDDFASVAWTDVRGGAHLSRVALADGSLVKDINLGSVVIRDMTAMPDGEAVLYFAGSAFGVRRIDREGKTIFDNYNQMVGTFSQLWHLGAVEAHGDQIGVYFGVSGNQGWNTGHEGDAFKIIAAVDGHLVNTGWDWGCSHSIDTRMAWVGNMPARLCLSDVYPSAGFNMDNQYSIQSTWGTHDGFSGGRIGGFISAFDTLYFVFDRGEYSGAGEVTEIMRMNQTAPYATQAHYSLGTEIQKSQMLAKIARLGTETILASWSYDGEARLMLQEFSVAIKSKSAATPVDGIVALARSDFRTLPNGNVLFAAKDMTAKEPRLVLETVSACPKVP